VLDARNKLATLNLSGAVDMSDQSSSLRYIGLAAAHLTAIIQTVDSDRWQHKRPGPCLCMHRTVKVTVNFYNIKPFFYKIGHLEDIHSISFNL